MPLIDDDLFMQMQSEYFLVGDLLATLEALLESEDVGVVAWRQG